MRGGEKVLDALCELLPDADLFTLVHVPGSTSARIEQRRVRTSFVQHLPFAARLYRRYLPLFPIAIEQFDLDGYDLVISCSHCVAKSVVTPGRTRHLCYCLTPVRYAWDQFDAYFGPARLGRAASGVLRTAMATLAAWDRDTAERADRYLAISQHVARRIAVYYNRRSTVVHPPVDTAYYTPASHPSASAERFLVVSALVPYKRVDLAIAATARARVPLTVVGEGPERTRLQAQAGAHVTFLGWRSDSEIRDLYRSSVATILPGEEDFGIVPVEAQACGRPVVALGRAGALDTVVHGATGILVQDDTEAAFADGVTRALAERWDSQLIRRHAERFSRQRFAAEMTSAIDQTMTMGGGYRW